MLLERRFGPAWWRGFTFRPLRHGRGLPLSTAVSGVPDHRGQTAWRLGLLAAWFRGTTQLARRRGDDRSERPESGVGRDRCAGCCSCPAAGHGLAKLGPPGSAGAATGAIVGAIVLSLQAPRASLRPSTAIRARFRPPRARPDAGAGALPPDPAPPRARRPAGPPEVIASQRSQAQAARSTPASQSTHGLDPLAVPPGAAGHRRLGGSRAGQARRRWRAPHPASTLGRHARSPRSAPLEGFPAGRKPVTSVMPVHGRRRALARDASRFSRGFITLDSRAPLHRGPSLASLRFNRGGTPRPPAHGLRSGGRLVARPRRGRVCAPGGSGCTAPVHGQGPYFGSRSSIRSWPAHDCWRKPALRPPTSEAAAAGWVAQPTGRGPSSSSE